MTKRYLADDGQVVVEERGNGAFAVYRRPTEFDSSTRNTINGCQYQDGVWVQKNSNGFAIYRDPRSTRQRQNPRRIRLSELERMIR